MKQFRIAILGCGTVGGGIAKILLEQKKMLSQRSNVEITLSRIVDLFPSQSAKRHGIDLSIFAGNGEDLDETQATRYIQDILEDEQIDLIVETIGGSGSYIVDLTHKILEHRKHLVTANKALLAENYREIFQKAEKYGCSIGYEASVCGAIPIIKGIKECFSGDDILAISGIMNGTSNFILSKMEAEQQRFMDALKDAQEQGYAETDPSLDINGGDAGHKLIILLQMVFGLDVSLNHLSIQGIDMTTIDDFEFAREMNCSIKLICFAKREQNNVYATVRPMMVKKKNFLSKIDGATNAVQVINQYSEENLLIGPGAGSLQTGSAIAADIVFVARHRDSLVRIPQASGYQFKSFEELVFPYNITFETSDIPGITGIIATAIGHQGINIDTVSHNRRNVRNAVFSIVTMPCSYNQITASIDEIKDKHPQSLLSEPKIMPILE